MFTMANNEFVSWLHDVIRQRGWTQSELARKANLSPTAITDVLSGRRNPGADFGNGIAKALDLPPEFVYRKAGLLPPETPADPVALEGLEILKQLEGEYKEDAIRYLRMRLQIVEEREERNEKGRKKQSATTR